MRERQPIGGNREAERRTEGLPKVLSFGKVEDMLDELVERPPDGNIVRIDSCIKDSEANKMGLGLRTASVLITTRRRDEIVVANLIHTYCQTVHGRLLREEDTGIAANNQRVVQRVIEEQFRERGFVTGRGTYALPDNLTIYRSTCDRVLFKDRRANTPDGLALEALQGAGGGLGKVNNIRRQVLQEGQGGGEGK